MNFLLVFIGGGLGSVLRYAISLLVKQLDAAPNFPLATLISNILSCVFFALVVYISVTTQKLSDAHRLLLLTGFCGGFSTFSTLSFENFSLLKHQHYTFLVSNIAISVVAGILIFWWMLRQLPTQT